MLLLPKENCIKWGQDNGGFTGTLIQFTDDGTLDDETEIRYGFALAALTAI
jgi:hypothetical protein